MIDWFAELYRIIKKISYGGNSKKLTAQFIAALNETLSPSGGGGISTASVTLTDEEIIALPGTSIEIVPAPSDGYQNVVVSAIISIDQSAAHYENVSDGDTDATRIIYTAGPDASIYVKNSDLFSEDISSVVLTSFTFIQGEFPRIYGELVTQAANSSLSLYCANTLGNLTEGDPSNSMKVTVLYYVAQLIT